MWIAFRLRLYNRCDATSIKQVFGRAFSLNRWFCVGVGEGFLFEFNNLSALKSVSMSVFSLSSAPSLMRIVNVATSHLQHFYIHAHPRTINGLNSIEIMICMEDRREMTTTKNLTRFRATKNSVNNLFSCSTQPNSSYRTASLFFILFYLESINAQMDILSTNGSSYYSYQPLLIVENI